mmetsp:Transcript_24151/g.77904  ORF Transcript_24151/g.77904 Transcript_24151/m.77904 type:complete len:839 (+) Transcript_24151:213-2729(+)
MASVPTDVTQFLSIAVPVVINILLFAVLSGCFVFNGKYPFVSSPLWPESKVGQAKGLCGWFCAMRSLKDADVMKNGGLDAFLALRRAQMRAEIVMRWCWVALPVAVVYALNLTGGSTEAGFARITFQNANPFHKNDGVRRTGSSQWRMWITVVASYVMPLLAQPIIDRFDEEAVNLMLEETKKAPAHHYAVVLSGIEEGSRSENVIREFFDAALGEGSVRKIFLLTNESVVPEGVSDDEEKDDDKESNNNNAMAAQKFASNLVGALGGTRQRFDAFKAAMGAAKRADLVYLAAKEKEEKEVKEGAAEKSASSKQLDSMMSMVGSKSPEETRKDAREKLETKRQALIRAADVDAGSRKATSAAVVIFDSVAKATSAATAPLGIANSWRVAPAPEPRDILWTALEGAESDQEIIDQKAATGERIKLIIAATWSLILTGLGIVAQYVLKAAEKNLTGGLKTLVLLVSGFVPGLIAPIMMSLMVLILNNINVAFRGSVECWNGSQLANRTTSDFVFFLQLVGFMVPLLGAALITSLLEDASDPLKVLKTMAINVPSQGYYFTMIVLVKMAVYMNASTRFVPWVIYKVKDWLLVKTDFERSQNKKPTPAVFAAAAGWETFAFLLAAVYTQLSPYVPVFMAIYLVLQVPAMRLELACISKTPHASNGLLWRNAVLDTYDCMFWGMVLTLLVLLFGNAPIQFAVMLPLVIVHGIVRGRSRHRFELRSVHGVSRGRLPLLEAAQIDHARGDVANLVIVPAVDHDKLYAPPSTLPHVHDDKRRAYLPGPPLALEEDDDLEVRQKLIEQWETRYDHPSKLPDLDKDKKLTDDEVEGPPHLDDPKLSQA